MASCLNTVSTGHWTMGPSQDGIQGTGLGLVFMYHRVQYTQAHESSVRSSPTQQLTHLYHSNPILT